MDHTSRAGEVSRMRKLVTAMAQLSRLRAALLLGAAAFVLSGCYYPPPSGLGYPGSGYYGDYDHHHHHHHED